VDVAAVVIGMVVGAGIFRTPALVAQAAGSAPLALVAWALGGAVSLLGALCYLELATAYPHAGGEYHYLRRSFGSELSFLFAWARLTVIQSGSLAMFAFVIGDYAARAFSSGGDAAPFYAAVSVGTLTVSNLVGVRVGQRLQALLVACIFAGLLLVIGCGVVAPPPDTPAAAGDTAREAPPGSGAFGLAMVFVLLTYGGWNEASYLSAELRSGPRALHRSLLGGIAALTALYLLINLALFRGLGFAGVARSQTVAADLVERASGGMGGSVVSVLVIIAALATMNAMIITGARSGYALGRDFERLAFLGRWRPDVGTPPRAVLAQGALALLFVCLGALTRRGFETMVELTAPVFWLFFLLVGVSLLVLRYKEPQTPRPFPVPLYPFTPLLFCGSAAYMLFASVVHTRAGALVALAVLVSGVPALYVARRHKLAAGEA
jgi:amino acid transporter